ncbi:MAG: CDP-alcohol phosphatidyltransferase family protein, partial [Pseudomonadota bacterium]
MRTATMTANALALLAPPLFLLAFLFVGLAVFSIRVWRLGLPELPDANRRQNTAIATPFLTRYVLWLLTPLELALAARGVSPNVISILSLLGCGMAGVTAATGHLAAAAWCYLAAGMLDIVDGRVALRTGRSSTAGA